MTKFVIALLLFSATAFAAEEMKPPEPKASTEVLELRSAYYGERLKNIIREANEIDQAKKQIDAELAKRKAEEKKTEEKKTK